ncbi:hypothetical protein PTSG_12809 [Salpingoeca rosetta]|uniref:MRH domain-containing protein n=1 Tax=Salpingoeca rosetta (strain ATCC 50818 / BSB-021) TaxID=946362 RepID=F2UL24_SALR5|nr:uncharacterized protein PTSG_12809 [Salpingoeca rosetta]EGD77823.1 hypothetical protein PTSG_12809 [Salpingoeca rosetta]|eukprot:XP_004990299.1 hypothetical protein PTSG_12809 [Salpingoeca rosetta]
MAQRWRSLLGVVPCLSAVALLAVLAFLTTTQTLVTASGIGSDAGGSMGGYLPLPAFDDAVQFAIQWTDPPSNAKLYESINMQTALGEPYTCYVPKTNIHEANDRRASDEDRAVTPPHPQQLLSSLVGQCYFRLEGYWSYEFCFDKFVRQYHEEKVTTKSGSTRTKVTEYYLGRLPVSSDDAMSGPPATASMVLEGEDRVYFSRVHGGGDACDLTGRPRETEVRFICSKGLGIPDGIVQVDETSTCKYMLVFASRALCASEEFVEKEEPEHPIVCSATAVLEEGQGVTIGDLEGEEVVQDRGGGGGGSDDTQHTRAKRGAPVGGGSLHLAKRIMDGSLCLQGGGRGWWRFEYCPGKHVMQFHKHEDGTTDKIMLGVWDEREHRRRYRVQDPDAPTAKKPTAKQLTQFFVGGDYCDAAKIDREVVVRMLCRRSLNPDQIHMSLEEDPKCKYTLTLRARAVCDILEFADGEGVIVPQTHTQGQDDEDAQGDGGD